MTICTGPELGVSEASAALRVRNTRPGQWSATGTSCTPQAASDLYKDPALGLWVPPVEFGCYYARQDSGPVATPLAFGSWLMNTFQIPDASLPASLCSSQQYSVISVFRINALVPQNAGLSWVLSAGHTAPPSTPPPSTYREHGRFKGWSDSADPAGTVYTMARTDTLQRFVSRTAGGSATVYQWQAVNAFQQGTGASAPTITRMVIETLIFAFDALAPINSTAV